MKKLILLAMVMGLPVVGFFFFSPLSAYPRCTVQDIEVGKTSYRIEYGFVIIVGEVINNCSEPVGVQLQCTIYGADNSVLDTNDFWPASTSNISQKSRFPWKTMMPHQKGIQKIGVRVIGTRKW